jgi:hypothetical protein
MAHPIKVTNRFATPYDTAEVLGVSRSRTNRLIREVRQLTDRILQKTRAKKEDLAGTSKKYNGRNAGAKSHTTKAKNSKASH